MLFISKRTTHSRQTRLVKPSCRPHPVAFGLDSCVVCKVFCVAWVNAKFYFIKVAMISHYFPLLPCNILKIAMIPFDSPLFAMITQD